jgi:hypothetical protein
MNPRIFASPQRVNIFANGFPYVTPSFGKHAADWTSDALTKERQLFVEFNRQVFPGFGKHRLNPASYQRAHSQAA